MRHDMFLAQGSHPSNPLQALLSIIKCDAISSEDLISALARDEQGDSNVICFLRAITAWQLHSRREEYSFFLGGVDAYNGTDGR